jgi:hypothetical protein
VASAPDIVTLHISRDLGSLPVIRVILDGVALRRDLPIDALDDLKLAVEAILADECAEGGRLALEVAAVGGSVSVSMDGLCNPGLKEALLSEGPFLPTKHCVLDMKVVLGSLVDEYQVLERPDGCYAVQMRKRAF